MSVDKRKTAQSNGKFHNIVKNKRNNKMTRKTGKRITSTSTRIPTQQDLLMHYLCRFLKYQNWPNGYGTELNSRCFKKLEKALQNEIPQFLATEEYHLASLYCIAAAESADKNIQGLIQLSLRSDINRVSKGYYESLRNHTGYIYLMLGNKAVVNGNKALSKRCFEVSQKLLGPDDVFANELIKGSLDTIENSRGALKLIKIIDPDEINEPRLRLRKRRLGYSLSEFEEVVQNPIHFLDIDTNKSIKNIKAITEGNLPFLEKRKDYCFAAKECLLAAQAIDFRFRNLSARYPGIFEDKITRRYYLSIKKYVGHLFLFQAIEEHAKGNKAYSRTLFEISDLFFTNEDLFTKDLIAAPLKASCKTNSKQKITGRTN